MVRAIDLSLCVVEIEKKQERVCANRKNSRGKKTNPAYSKEKVNELNHRRRAGAGGHNTGPSP